MRFTIALSGAAYAVKGPVPLRMTLTNASRLPVRASGRLAINDPAEPAPFREVTFAVRTPSGRQAAFRLDIKIRAARAGDLVSLSSGRSVSKTVDLAHYYALDERGAYEVRATYSAAAPGGAPGPIVSNTVRFALR